MDNVNPGSKAKTSGIIWVVLTIAAFLLAIFFLVDTFRSLQRQGFFGPPNGQNFHRKKIAITNIQSWMTFDFINKSFGLPPDYLKNGLGITDKKYPNITVDGWAKKSQENPDTMLGKVRQLIQDFQNPNSPKIPASV